MKRFQAVLHRLPLVSLLGVLLVFAACNGSSSGSTGKTPTGGPSPTATPAIPGGDYAFVRNGDMWARVGASVAHAVTFLHLSANGATWGTPVWSPDRTMLAFVLYSPPVAPGQSPSDPVLGAGTVFVVNLATGAITSLHGSANGYQVPLLGRHIAWMDNSTLLFTQAGSVQEAKLGQPATFTSLAGPKEVWEIVVRGGTLFYTTVTGITPGGSGTAELHSFDLGGKGADKMLATLGPVKLPSPPASCGILCPPDTATPYVPYAWDASSDGSQIAYQQANAASTATPTATPASAAGATPTQTPSSTHLMLAHGDGSQSQAIFQNIAAPADLLDLAFAPDRQHIALAPAGAGSTFSSPWVQGLAPQPSAPLAIQPPTGAGNQVTLSGPLTWSSDSHAFSLALNPIPAQRTTQVYTFTTAGQSALTEVNASDFAWA